MKEVTTVESTGDCKFTLSVIDGAAVGEANRITVVAEGISLGEFLRRSAVYVNKITLPQTSR